MTCWRGAHTLVARPQCRPSKPVVSRARARCAMKTQEGVAKPMPSLGPIELIVILVIVVVIFGAGRVSELGGALGNSLREFRQSTRDETARAAARCASCGAENS